MEVFNEINQVLSYWNPLNVDSNMAIDEYKSYVPAIINRANNRQELMKYLIELLTDKLGVTFDSKNITHLNDLRQICDKIMAVYINTSYPLQ